MYSVENAKKYNWSSISGNLNPERLSYLDKYLAGNKILDAGCGGGAYVEFLSEKKFEVTGVDKHDDFLKMAIDRNGLGTYIQCEISSLPFPDNYFDSTYCFDVLEHVDDFTALKELKRVTKGRLIITVPKEDEIMQRYNLTFSHYSDKTHLRNYTVESLSSLLSRFGLSKFEIFPELFIPFRSMIFETATFSGKLDNSSIVKKARSFLFGKMLNSINFTDVPTGLVAVVYFK